MPGTPVQLYPSSTAPPWYHLRLTPSAQSDQRYVATPHSSFITCCCVCRGNAVSRGALVSDLHRLACASLSRPCQDFARLASTAWEQFAVRSHVKRKAAGTSGPEFRRLSQVSTLEKCLIDAPQLMAPPSLLLLRRHCVTIQSLRCASCFCILFHRPSKKKGLRDHTIARRCALIELRRAPPRLAFSAPLHRPVAPIDLCVDA